MFLFLLNTYGFIIKEQEDKSKPELLGKINLDLRSQRGVGFGFDVSNRNYRFGDHGLKLYYTKDNDPTLARSGFARNLTNDDRWKIEFKYKHVFYDKKDVTWYTDFNVTALSDDFFLQDFEPQTFRTNFAPDNTFAILRKTPTLLGGIFTRFELNDFYQNDTRLPEIFIDRVKGPIGKTPVLYEGNASLSIVREFLDDEEISDLEDEFADLSAGDPRIEEIEGLLNERGFTRFNTHHEFSLPLKPASGVSLVPFAGFGHTRYWDIENGTSDFDRTHFSGGIDLAFKFSKKYPNIVIPKWGLNQVLHTIQPYLNYSYLSTDSVDPSFGTIDALTPTTNLRPIRVGRFSAIDELATWSILRAGVRNKLITKRNDNNHDWLITDTYFDYFFIDPELNRRVSNLYNDVLWNPVPWLQVGIETQVPISNNSGDFTEFAGRATWMPNEKHEYSLRIRHLDSHPVLVDSTQVEVSGYSRINESLGFRTVLRWELEDGTLETQQYTIDKDLGSWTASLGVLSRNNRVNTESTVLLSFTLKEFPSLSIPLSLDSAQ